MAEGRPSTPPRATRSAGQPLQDSITAEQIRKREEARLKAKAAARAAEASRPPPPVAGAKRPYSVINATNTPSNARDQSSPQKRDQNGFIQPKDNDLIRPAKNFSRAEYIEYDFSKMTDTKGGFLSTDDDPLNRAMWSGKGKEEEKPANMTLAEWERERVMRKLRENRLGPYEPGISILNNADGKEEEQDEIALAEVDGEEYKGRYGDGKRDVKGKCRECSSLEIDWKWQDVFGIGVCAACKDKYPDKYSLLTKTEAREDYLLTDPELKDEALLPHLERPNPHKTNWNNMQLFLRLQVEYYALSEQKWGSAEALDVEYERRTQQTKARKEKKFKNKLDELKKRTRVEAYKRARLGDGGASAQFGDRIKGIGDKHVHEWGRSVLNPESGMMKKRCEDCGMEVEELEF
ncbi:DNA repair protein-like protein rad14 [Polyplosphaeria fusca]|uniref:DNA repair protein RAD14 n=1 Tax=Polyplosphaeria fusca TaxID=682080 RepID=A0A9P4UZQ1_9PLEO|nr:DNA repair protein-like protein rad14 [Polyplosphaeria fusca]